jgi:CDP-paratose 2-epimerase
MRWLVTGGAGFIGTNLYMFLREYGHDVEVIDDLSRSGSAHNALVVQERYGYQLTKLDVTDREALWSFLADRGPFDAIAHLAGQVSMIASLADPLRDFEINAIGTLNILEYVRTKAPETAVVGMSSNKVYGSLSSVEIDELPSRFVAPKWPHGLDETLPLSLETPYGCSKGIADQYLGDYGAVYGLRTISFRQSSVYGPFQNPRADQGWVAHMLQMAAAGQMIQLNGVGKQVRDLLHVADLSRLIEMIPSRLDAGSRLSVNVGGGPANSLSILELFQAMKEVFGLKVEYRTGEMRVSDQRYFVSDNVRLTNLCGWTPTISLDEGIAGLIESEGYRGTSA